MKKITTITDPTSPDFGQVTEVDIPDPAPLPLDSSRQRKAIIRGRAAQLDKKGRYAEATALRATIGE